MTKFQAFWKSFKCAVGENESLSEAHKLTYLVNLLEGLAFKALEWLKITGGNYRNSVDILKQRFDKMQQIIKAHMQKLLNLVVSYRVV